MKNILFAFFLAISFIGCNGPEQNSTVGNSEDSTTVKGTDSIDNKGPGLESSGGAPGPGILTDTVNSNADSLDQAAKKKKALRK